MQDIIIVLSVVLFVGLLTGGIGIVIRNVVKEE